MAMGISWILLGLLSALLLAACWCDLKSRTIPNGLNLAIALLAIPFWWSIGLALWPDVALQVGVALLVFFLFADRLRDRRDGRRRRQAGRRASHCGCPGRRCIVLLFIMSVAGGVLTLAMYARHKLARKAGQLEIPYGVAIAFGGLWLISERFLNQFG